MQHVSLRGEQVPAVGLGTWELEGASCRQAVAEALDMGYRHIDTAQAYDNEGQIGEVLRTSAVDRGEIFLTTKVANRNHAPSDVHRSVGDSLRALGSDYVDLLLVHWPVEFDTIGQTLEAMLELHAEGKVRHIGVSNFSPTQFELAAEIAPVACNQVEYHPFLSQAAVLEMARKHDAIVTAYSPLARGDVVSDGTITEIAERHGKSPAQVALRWLIEQDGVTAVPKASSREHLAANLDLFDFALTDADRERIDGLSRGERIIDPPFGPDWDG
ncbi:MAG: aldo/keto reductase [Euzebyales bacterium]|nr:aldo/keto reductase [Euzebyales bacterium]